VGEFYRVLASLRQEDRIRRAQYQRLVRQAVAAATAGRSKPDGSGGQMISGLPRALWLVVLGIFVNYVGYGAILPFEVIYLHDGRGFSLVVAGLVVSLITGVAVVVAAPVGTLIDRLGARAIAAAGAGALAVGYTGLALARSPVLAVAAAVIAGAGNGALNPSQSTLLVTLTPPRLRHRGTAVARVSANIGAGLGGALGGLVAAHGLAGFVALLLANAVSYLILMAVVLAVVRDEVRPQQTPRGYALVLRDRAFVHLAVVNVALIAVGWGAFTWLVPPYASGQFGLSAPLIGLLLLANTGTVAVAQIPIARLAEGRHRVAMMAWAAAAFVVACLLVVLADGWLATYPALLAATILVGVGECLHTTVLMPLTADLAPDSLRGRYMASMGLSWWVGLAIAPALAAPFLEQSPLAVFLAAAAVALAAGTAALRLNRRLPAAARLTPSAVGADR
jgi:MFS family permease